MWASAWAVVGKAAAESLLAVVSEKKIVKVQIH